MMSWLSLLKFVKYVVQWVIPGDLDAPRNPWLGTVSLILAQYVDAEARWSLGSSID